MKTSDKWCSTLIKGHLQEKVNYAYYYEEKKRNLLPGNGLAGDCGFANVRDM